MWNSTQAGRRSAGRSGKKQRWRDNEEQQKQGTRGNKRTAEECGMRKVVRKVNYLSLSLRVPARAGAICNIFLLAYLKLPPVNWEGNKCGEASLTPHECLNPAKFQFLEGTAKVKCGSTHHRSWTPHSTRIHLSHRRRRHSVSRLMVMAQ